MNFEISFPPKFLKGIDFSNNPIAITIGRGDRHDKRYKPSHKSFAGAVASVCFITCLMMYSQLQLGNMYAGTSDEVN